MQEAFFGFISQFGYLAVAALILFENVFPPIPSELILPLSGFLAPRARPRREVLERLRTLPRLYVCAVSG